MTRGGGAGRAWQAAWDDYDHARADADFAALHRAYLDAAGETDPLLGVMIDRLIDLGLTAYEGLIIELVKVARRNHQLPF